MRAHIILGRVFGVRIGLHYSWFAIAFLITLSLGAMFRQTTPHWSPLLSWGLAMTTALLFFACLLAHELSHAVVARSRGIEVRGITLFALGGVAQIAGEAADPKTELWMGAVGPLTSAVIGYFCLLLAGLWPEGGPPSPGQALFGWLGVINLALAVFNLIPGFPLDGGRVLRALAWWWTKSYERATRIAARGGQLVAYLLIFWGLWRLFAGAGIGGLWMAFIGFFLLDAAGASYLQVEAQEALRSTRVGDIMAKDLPAVDGAQDLRSFVEDSMLRTGRRLFVVRHDGDAAGIITPHEVKSVEPSRWSQTTVDQVKRPIESLRSVSPGTPVVEALEIMGREDLNQLPVVAGGRMEGVISRSQVLQLLQTRREIPA